MRRSLREDSNLCRTRVRSPVLCPLSYGGMWCVRPLHPSGKKCGWRDSNPHGPRPPVSETGASARFRHIRMRLGAGTPRARAERVTGRKRESRRRLVGLTRHPAGAAARVVPPRGAPCGALPGRSPWPDAQHARGAGGPAERCVGADASHTPLSVKAPTAPSAAPDATEVTPSKPARIRTRTCEVGARRASGYTTGLRCGRPGSTTSLPGAADADRSASRAMPTWCSAV